jgi:ankyrin repeat protein
MELLHESGQIIAERYRIIGTLGEGGIGTTYQAEDLQNNQQVALKALSLKGMSDWKMTELFEREARVLSVLNHPGIPQYIDYFQVDTESDRGFYIAQQLAPGKSLAVLVESGWHANEAEVKRIAIQILEILVYLHKQTPPVIHRDIKPQNIIRDEKGQIFLVDFGAVQDTYQSTFARSSTVVGTFGYMAPEQFRGQAVPATDLYGLGATLLFLLTHRSPADLPQDRLKIDFRSRVQISGDFADFLEKLLEPDVEDRFISAKEALDVLRGKRNLAGKSGAALSWKTLLGVGVAGIFGFIVLNSFKYTILKSIGMKPSLCEAIKNSQTDIVKSYLNQGGNANDIDADKDIQGMSLLNCALSFHKKNIAELLITKGADVNAKDKDKKGNSLLHWLITDSSDNLHDRLVGNYVTPEVRWVVTNYSNSEEMIELLIAKGADVNAKNNQGNTPLYLAVGNNQKELAELLLLKGADVNTKNKKGLTPLHNAKRKEIIELLIAKGANINAQDNQGNMPLHLYLSSKYLGFITNDYLDLIITREGQVNTKNKQGQTPIKVALMNNNLNAVTYLIEKGAYLSDEDIKTKDSQGNQPIHRAALYYGNQKFMNLLIAKGADVNAKNKQGQTPIQVAWMNNNWDAVTYLIEKGAYLSDEDIKTKDAQGDQPIHHAVLSHNQKFMNLLIAKGADVNAKNKQGQTPIQVALMINNWDAVTYLIEKGAYLSDEDIKTEDSQGNQLIHWAALNGNQKLVNLLIAKGADVNANNYHGDTPIVWAARNGRKDVVELLLTKGANVNVKYNEGSTPLQMAISLEEIERYNDDYKQTIKLLIAKGSDINVKALLDNGRTPLHLAALANWPDVAEMLIAKGAKINFKNVYGRTPLHNAAESGNKNVMEVLLAKGKGLEVNSRDNNGFTPLGLAAANNYSDIVELLKSHGGIE